jgi:hypothetical protein
MISDKKLFSSSFYILQRGTEVKNLSPRPLSGPDVLKKVRTNYVHFSEL